jgi:hypothetical protein
MNGEEKILEAIGDVKKAVMAIEAKVLAIDAKAESHATAIEMLTANDDRMMQAIGALAERNKTLTQVIYSSFAGSETAQKRLNG